MAASECSRGHRAVPVQGHGQLGGAGGRRRVGQGRVEGRRAGASAPLVVEDGLLHRAGRGLRRRRSLGRSAGPVPPHRRRGGRRRHAGSTRRLARRQLGLPSPAGARGSCGSAGGSASFWRGRRPAGVTAWPSASVAEPPSGTSGGRAAPEPGDVPCGGASVGVGPAGGTAGIGSAGAVPASAGDSRGGASVGRPGRGPRQQAPRRGQRRRLPGGRGRQLARRGQRGLVPQHRGHGRLRHRTDRLGQAGRLHRGRRPGDELGRRRDGGLGGRWPGRPGRA